MPIQTGSQRFDACVIISVACAFAVFFVSLGWKRGDMVGHILDLTLAILGVILIIKLMLTPEEDPGIHLDGPH